MTEEPDRDARIADYVLGLMEPAAADAFEAEILRDASLRQDVTDWQVRLAELDDTVEPEPMDDRLWRRIESDLPAAAPVPGRRSTRPGAPWVWSSLGFWRGASLALSAVALVLAAGLTWVVQRPPPAPLLVAVLTGGDGAVTPGAVIEIGSDGRARLLSLVPVSVPRDKALQVWTLPSRDIGPVSIGLIDRARSGPLDLGSLPQPQPTQLFEITLEPASGSPTNRPTGPILFKGFAAPPL